MTSIDRSLDVLKPCPKCGFSTVCAHACPPAKRVAGILELINSTELPVTQLGYGDSIAFELPNGITVVFDHYGTVHARFAVRHIFTEGDLDVTAARQLVEVLAALPSVRKKDK